jgi:hypothetical protein
VKRVYRVESCQGSISIVLEIDSDIMGAQLATEINDFWSGADVVLAVSVGDIYQAVARRAFAPLMHFLMDGYSEDGAIKQLDNQEGWTSFGMKILEYEIPDMDPEYLAVYDDIEEGQ